ncbi:MAG TPA: hypothetical protein DDW49_10985 [Deltaproteobacteria bacterium]|nr:MAG: hypothetical protein A2048_01940 [Deltaproteobacteria bacterium GWA2_45_12]HBF13889.1 hypothetical protein [Deltaproteobacteria bacterium]
MNIKQISVKELKNKIDNKENFKLVDCREKTEYDLCRIEGSTFIPLSEFSTCIAAQNSPLHPDDEIVIHCHHGGRSMKACQYLTSLGYKNVTNLSGGIHDWSVEIDPSVKQY